MNSMIKDLKDKRAIEARQAHTIQEFIASRGGSFTREG